MPIFLQISLPRRKTIYEMLLSRKRSTVDHETTIGVT